MIKLAILTRSYLYLQILGIMQSKVLSPHQCHQQVVALEPCTKNQLHISDSRLSIQHSYTELQVTSTLLVKSPLSY